MTGSWVCARFLITQVEADFINSCHAAPCYCRAPSQIHCAAPELQLHLTGR